jgi:hypothetical protein
MQLDSAMPSIDTRYLTASADALKSHGRVDLVRLSLVTAVLATIHWATATAKLLGIVRTREGVFREGQSHLKFSIKLTMAAACLPLGLIRPEWSLKIYRQLSLTSNSRLGLIGVVAATALLTAVGGILWSRDNTPRPGFWSILGMRTVLAAMVWAAVYPHYVAYHYKPTNKPAPESP